MSCHLGNIPVIKDLVSIEDNEEAPLLRIPFFSFFIGVVLKSVHFAIYCAL